MRGKQVWLLSYNAGVIGLFVDRQDAVNWKKEYSSYGYKGLKVEERTIY